jgi:hypothetical protein
VPAILAERILGMVVEAGAILFDRPTSEKVPGRICIISGNILSQTGWPAGGTMECSSKCVCRGGAPEKWEIDRCMGLD